MHRRSSFLGIVLFILVLCVPAIRAQDGLRGALSRSRESAHLGSVIGEQVVAADFDNDEKPDGAVMLESGQMAAEKVFRIEFHLTARQNATISFSSRENGLVISTLDVNRDGAPDIVVDSVFTHKRLKVYLNDGHGTFHNASPEAFPAPDESAPMLHAWVNAENLPPLFMYATRGFEVARTVLVTRKDDAVQTRFWPEVLIPLCGARAPSGSRAPPSPLSL